MKTSTYTRNLAHLPCVLSSFLPRERERKKVEEKMPRLLVNVIMYNISVLFDILLFPSSLLFLLLTSQRHFDRRCTDSEGIR